MKKRFAIIAFLTTLILSSCEIFNRDLGSDNTINIPDSSQDIDNFKKPEWYHPADNDFSYTDNAARKHETSQVLSGNTLHDLYSKGFPQKTLNSIGNQNLLVIPVNLKSGTTCNKYVKGCTGLRNDIERSFFGETDETGFESVSSFYYKSSYGYLNIQGFVTPWFDSSYSVKQLISTNIDGYEILDPTYLVLREAVAWFKESYPSLVSSFDQNHDGFIDAVWLVYSEDYHTSISDYQDLLWAYTFWDVGVSNVGNIDSPTANVYSWASANFMYDMEDSYGEYPDAHTYIHETGHILGLEDYYSYDDDDSPCGGLDMMDANILDHNPFSKMLMQWVEPTVINEAKDYTLKPFQNDGEFFLIPSGMWNNTVFDEYLIIEFYTPTNLNESDSKDKYSNGYQGFTTAGIKVYHVDARLGIFRYKSQMEGFRFAEYTTEITYDYATQMAYTSFAHDNTKSRSVNGNKLIQFMESGGKYTLGGGRKSLDDKALYKLDDDFGITTYRTFRFNNRANLDYNFEVTALNENVATLSFS